VFYKAKALDPIPPVLVLPEVTTYRSGGEASFTTSDPENQYLLNINGENRMVVAFNTKLVNPAEIKSYWDLLNPKWKGKIVAYDPSLAARATPCAFSITAKSLGPEFIRRILTETDIVISTDTPPNGRLVGGWKFAFSDLWSGIAHGIWLECNPGAPVGGSNRSIKGGLYHRRSEAWR